jgi:DNA-binding transcriptional LysR family regulator
VSIEVDNSKQLVERLRSGALDIVIGRIYEPSGASELRFEPITDEPHSLVVRAGHPLLGVSGLGLKELAEQTWIVPPAGSVVRDRITSLFLSQGFEQPLDTVSAAALPVMMTQLDSGQLAVLPFDLNLRMDVYGFITRRQHRLSPAAEILLGALREVAAARPSS